MPRARHLFPTSFVILSVGCFGGVFGDYAVSEGTGGGEGGTTSQRECSADAECANKGVGLVCREQKCTPECSADAECANKGVGSVCREQKCTVECTTNQECIDSKGGPYICRQSKCVSLLSEDCFDVIGKVSDDNAIVFGYMSLFTGGLKFIGNNYVGANRMAHQEFTDNLPGGGIPGPGGIKRPLVMVICDEIADTTRATKHLVENVGVQIIHGPTFDDAILQAAAITVPAGVLIVSGNGAGDAVVNLDDNGLVWLATFPQSTLHPVFVPAMLDAEQRIKAKHSLQTVRIATLANGTALDQSGQDTLTKMLKFNGKTALENQTDDNFARFSYPDPSVDKNIDYTVVIKSILDFKPHILIGYGFSEYSTKIIPGIEADWPTDPGAPPRPEYWGYSEDPDFVTIGKRPELMAVGIQKRLRGVRTKHVNQETYDLYFSRYRAANKNAKPLVYSEFNYDTFYAIVYAMMAAGPLPKEQLTGSVIAQQFAKLNPKPGVADIFVDPDLITNASQQLLLGNGINLEGTSGHLDFELTKGFTPVIWEGWCLNKELKFVGTGQVFNPDDLSMTPQTTFCDQE